MISPTGVQAVDPDGEVAVARAAANRGVVMGLSSFASKPIEEVVAANPQTFFQMYWCGTRDQIVQRMERAQAAGAVGLIVTLDWSFSNGRDWGSPTIPEKVDFKAAMRFAPEALTHPQVAGGVRQDQEDPRPHRAQHGRARPAGAHVLRRLLRVDADPAPHLGRRRLALRQSGAARSCSRASAASTTPAAPSTPASPRSRCRTTAATTSTAPRPRSARCPSIVDAVGNQVDVVLDGGVRRGSDVVKAVALGAKAVMIGRAYLWGLAANGQAGVENVLDILRGGHRLGPARHRPRRHPRPHAATIVVPAGLRPHPGPAGPGDAVNLGSATWTELGRGRRRATSWLVPLGSTEQHGPHLPLVDRHRHRRRASPTGPRRQRPDVVVAPALPYGSSGEHAGFPGTLSIGQDALEHVVVELVRSADAFAAVVLVSGHGGNAEPLAGPSHPAGRGPAGRRRGCPRGSVDAARRAHRDVDLARPGARARPDRCRRGRRHPADHRAAARTARRRRARGGPQRRARRSDRSIGRRGTPPARRPGRRPRRHRRPDWPPVAEPVAIITGAGRGIGAATARPPGRRRLAPGPRRPRAGRSRPRTTRWPPRPSSKAVADALRRTRPGRRRRRPMYATRPGSTPRSRSRSTASAASMPPSPSPVPSAGRHRLGDRRRGRGTPWSASTSRASGAWPAPPSPRCCSDPSRGAGGSSPCRRPAARLGLPRCRGLRRGEARRRGLRAQPRRRARAKGITANVVAPGSTSTAMLDASARRLRPRRHRPSSRCTTSSRASSTADEVAALLEWLCGPDSSAITGAVLPSTPA